MIYTKVNQKWTKDLNKNKKQNENTGNKKKQNRQVEKQ